MLKGVVTERSSKITFQNNLIYDSGKSSFEADAYSYSITLDGNWFWRNHDGYNPYPSSCVPKYFCANAISIQSLSGNVVTNNIIAGIWDKEAIPVLGFPAALEG